MVRKWLENQLYNTNTRRNIQFNQFTVAANSAEAGRGRAEADLVAETLGISSNAQMAPQQNMR